ncbi:hypothetical protein ES708_02353 [subsurface metagenome]
MKLKKHVNRRQFLKASAVGIAAPYVVPASVFGATAPSNRLNLGIIGCGGKGHSLTRRFCSNDDVQVVAVCDVVREHRLRTKRMVEQYYTGKTSSDSYIGCDDYNDFRDVIYRDDIDIIYEALPYQTKAIVITMAADAKKDIYGEKPIGYDITDGRAIVNAVRRNNIVFQSGTQQRSNENFRFACELALNGRIGKLHTIHARLLSRAKDRELISQMTPEERNKWHRSFYNVVDDRGGQDLRHADVTNIPQPEMPIPEDFDYDMWLGPAPWAPYTQYRCHFNFRFIFDYGGGRLADWAPHHCDIAQWGMGMAQSGPVEIEGTGTFPTEGLWNTAISYNLTCKYDNGVKMLVYDVAQPDCGVLFEGTEGTILVGRTLGIMTKPKNLLTTIIRRNEINLPRSRDHIRNFIDCVKTREEPVAPVEHGHRATSISTLCNTSLRLGRKLNWDPENEQFLEDPEANRMITRPYRSPWRLKEV